MTTLKTNMALAATLAGVIALGATTSADARNRTWVYAGAGFAAGALLGAAVASSNANAYYGPGYAYDPYGYGYAPGYTYAPAYQYVESAPAYVYTPAPAYAYGYPYYPEGRRSTTVKSSNEE